MPANFYQLLDMNLKQMHYIMPEVMVVVTFLFALIFDFVVTGERRKNTGYICIVGLLVSLWLCFQQNEAFYYILRYQGYEAYHVLQKPIYSGMLMYDHFGTFFKMVLIIGTIVSLMLALYAKELYGKNHGEFYLLLVAVCMGGMFLVSSSNLLMIYLSLEALSIVSYAMAGYLRRDRKSAEAGIKYVIYGAMASGIMIFGMSYLYGIFGTLNIMDTYDTAGYVTNEGIATQLKHFGENFAEKVRVYNELVGRGSDAVSPHLARSGIVAVLVMVFIGFLYKIAAVPFHYWSPDVYEGAPTTAAGFFSVVPKAAGFAVMIRVLYAFFPLGSTTANWLDHANVEMIMSIVAVATMTIGNLAALGQTNAKRMLAYSSIAHAGYMLAGLTVLDASRSPETLGMLTGPASVLFYLVVYLFMNLGAFIVLVALENIFGGSELSQLRGAVRREPILAITLCVFLFSLTGLPPLAGFIGKYLIMVELAARGKYMMILWIGINSVISLYYYMKLAKAVTIDKPEFEAPAERTPWSYNALVVGKCVALLILFIYFEPVRQLCLQVLEPLR